MIRQPQNRTFSVRNQTIRLQYNPRFAGQRQELIIKAQKFVDSECMRLMQPYIPRLTGFLAHSAVLATVIGSGTIEYNAPYARYLYYGKLMVGAVSGSPWARLGETKVLTDIDLKYRKTVPKAGAFWFERMKADKKAIILRGAAAVLGVNSP